MINVEALIEAFRIEEPLAQSCATAQGAYLRCEQTSKAFIKFLRSKGYTPKLYGMRGTLKNPRCHPSYLKNPNIEHWLVKIGEVYVDWTIKQIDSGAPVPATYHNLDEIKTNWKQFTSDPQEVWEAY